MWRGYVGGQKTSGAMCGNRVEPDTALRGPDHLAMMRTHFGHSDLGVFAAIKNSGHIKAGSKITLL